MQEVEQALVAERSYLAQVVEMMRLILVVVHLVLAVIHLVLAVVCLVPAVIHHLGLMVESMVAGLTYWAMAVDHGFALAHPWVELGE